MIGFLVFGSTTRALASTTFFKTLQFLIFKVFPVETLHRGLHVLYYVRGPL
jgi:hypothetical protein